MTATLYLLTICLPLAAALLIFGMKYGAAVMQSRARQQQDDTLQRVASQAAQAQAEANSTLASMRTTLADLDARLARIEQVLRQVD